MVTTTYTCPCAACREFRLSKAEPRHVRYFDRIVPAWHVPLTREHARYTRAYTALHYAHERPAVRQLYDPAAGLEWERLVAQAPSADERALFGAVAL